MRPHPAVEIKMKIRARKELVEFDKNIQVDRSLSYGDGAK
jgi:hypothetical protein